MNTPPFDQTIRCPALLLCAPASGHGKTSLTAGLARWYTGSGYQVQVFKVGPDFLDPMILQRASGRTVYQLDLWMTGERECRALLFEAAQTADIIIIEGVMGLFDGDPCSADLAQKFGIPLAAVIDASAMAGTFGAIALGLYHYRPGLPWAGVIANRVASAYHAQILSASLRDVGPLLATIRRDDRLHLPRRHLGLVQAAEVADIDSRLDALAVQFAETSLAHPPEPVAFAPATAALTQAAAAPSLAGVRVAIAKDPAFSFIYPANIRLLQSLGAEVVWFSPLTDAELPPADSVFLPGGYPELYLQSLEQNESMRAAIRDFAHANGRIYAECGGMLYLLQSLTDQRGRSAALAGVLAGSASMQDKLAALGMQIIPLAGGAWRGHTFHHSTANIHLPVHTRGRRARSGAETPDGEAVYCYRNTIASYIHAYFPSDPPLVARVFGDPEYRP